MIKVKNLTKKFKQTVAVDDISFEIKQGEIVGVLGPNGAGKTTTLRILAGYLYPDKGQITMQDQNFLKNDNELKLDIGYMPENNPIYKNMLVKDLLLLTLNLNNIPKDKHKERIDYVLNAVDIKDKYYRPISELSKGYKQRVGLAQALINDPNILILDEPTEGLDPNQRAEIRSLIKDVGKKRTAIISTHVMQEVEAMCNRIIIIHKGKIIADGKKEEILKMKEEGDRIKLDIEGKGIKKAIQKIDHINVLQSKTKKGRTKMEIELLKEAEDKVYEDISKLIAKNKWVLYRLEPMQNTLEEIFYKLTK
ncbi:ATP-binding cassette domain-containing protein [Candidatus Dojkabacteria bacterium]|nr:ATP-binding cassette domain-containing protein [Candidatus Dojkabacteria bacterium]